MESDVHTRLATFSKLTAVLGLCVATTMCRSEHAATPTQERRPGRLAPLSQQGVEAVRDQSRLMHGRVDLAWVGELHTTIMQEWLDRRAGAGTLPSAQACEHLTGLVHSHFADVKRHVTAADEWMFVRVLRDAAARVGCGSPAGLGHMSLLTATQPPTEIDIQPDTSPVSMDSSVTGAYEPYVVAIQTAVAAATTPEEATEAVDAVLMQASQIPAPDFVVLQAVAEVVSSSAWYWAANSGLADGEPLAIFRHATFSWRSFAGADFAGASAALGFARAAGVKHPYLIVCAIVGGAAVGSAGYAWPYVFD